MSRKHTPGATFTQKLNDASRQAKKRQETKLWYRGFMEDKACEVCEERHPATLDWHHRDPETKRYTVSSMVTKGYGIDKILAEIAKCSCLCSNCHRIFHWNERYPENGWGLIDEERE